MSSSLVNCSVCNKSFLKDNRHINENKKLNHKFYCSIQCQSLFKNKQVEITCENISCQKNFRRQLNYISSRNFCSQKCAMKFIGPENGKKHQKIKYCHTCGSQISSQYTYCSPKCWGLDHQISKDFLLKELKKLSKKLGRSPTKREFKSYHSCIKYFGSWNNALIEASLQPNRSLNQRMYQRRLCKARDGHACNSVSELIIDNWLLERGIKHVKEAPYPSGKFTADWMINNVLVEYFGLANDSRRYDNSIKKKKQICQKFGVKLVEIYSKDLFPNKRLDEIFNF